MSAKGKVATSGCQSRSWDGGMARHAARTTTNAARIVAHARRSGRTRIRARTAPTGMSAASAVRIHGGSSGEK
jgi:hypothetical protein